MINIILSGSNGKMGQVITDVVSEEKDFSIVAGIDSYSDIVNKYPIYENIRDFDKVADVIIDFSNPSMLKSLLEYSVKSKTPLVIASTGYSPDQLNDMKKASESVPILFSGNMSLGINVMLDLIKTATKGLSDFDIEVIEKHHNKKIDAPSGTAFMLANQAVESREEESTITFGRHGNDTKRDKSEIGVHAVRGGTIVGEHTVIYAGTDEIIEIKHTAMSKKIFATGSLKAAKFLVNQKPNLYNMKDLFSSIND